MLFSIIATALLGATITAASLEYIAIHGPPQSTHEAAQKLYNTLGGTFSLSHYNISGFENATLSGLLFSQTPSDIMNHFSNTTLGKRDATFKAAGCEEKNKDDVYTLSLEQQTFIANIFCTHVAEVQAGVWAGLGMFYSNVYCGKDWGHVCTVFITLAASQAGVFVSKGLQINCEETYKNIRERCELKGGAEYVTPRGANPAEGYGYTYATTVDVSGACSTSASKKCYHLACDDNGCTSGNPPSKF